MKKIIFISGASGVGKTSLINKLKEKYEKNKDIEFLHFDSIKIPSFDEMIEKYGSPEAFQKKETTNWINKMINNYNNKDLIIFEGQVNLQFIIDGFKQNNFTDYEIVLIDCNEKTMKQRLVEFRKQPELFDENMINWLNFLRKQAQDLNINILDTSNLTKEDVVKNFEDNILNKYL